MNKTIENVNEALMEALNREQTDLEAIEVLLKKGADPLEACKNKKGWRISTVVEYILNQYELNDYEKAPKVIQLFFDYGMTTDEVEDPFDEPEMDPLFNVALVPNEAGIRMLKVFLDHSPLIHSIEQTILHIMNMLRANTSSDSFCPGGHWFDEAVYQVKMIMLIASYPQVLKNSTLLQDLIACKDNDLSSLIQFREWEASEYSIVTLPVEDNNDFIEDISITIKDSVLKNVIWTMDISWKNYPYQLRPNHDYSSPLLDLLKQMPPDLSAIEDELQKGYSREEVSRAATEYAAFNKWKDLEKTEDTLATETDYSKPSAYLYSVMELLLKYGLDPNAVFYGHSMMQDLYWIGNNYAGADTLALLIEHGAEPMLVLDRLGETLFEDVSIEIRFAAIELYDRQTYDAIVHSWFVLLAYQGNKECNYFSPLKTYSDKSHREDYELEPFDISDLKNHRNFTFGLTFEEKGWALHIIDKRSWWEVARW